MSSCTYAFLFFIFSSHIWPLHLSFLQQNSPSIINSLLSFSSPHLVAFNLLLPLLLFHQVLTDFSHSQKLLNSNLFLASVLQVSPLRILFLFSLGLKAPFLAFCSVLQICLYPSRYLTDVSLLARSMVSSVPNNHVYRHFFFPSCLAVKPSSFVSFKVIYKHSLLLLLP